MWKLRLCILAACGVFGMATGASALADPGGQPNSNASPNAGGSSNSNASSNSGGNSSSNANGNSSSSSNGDSNAGDVWLDNVGQPAGPGHEMDPHLACSDIALYGDKLADSSGTYTIDGWPPSGSKEVDYSGNWSYNQSQGGTQQIATISVSTLIANATKNGDTAAKQGYHFKLDLSQDPAKHKVFWVNCSSSPSSSSTSNGPCAQPEQGQGTEHGKKKGLHKEHANKGKHKGEGKHGKSTSTSESSPSTCSSSSGTSNGSSTINGSSTSTSNASTAPTTTASAPSGSVKASHVRRHRRHHRKHHGLVKPRRRHHAPRRSVQAVSVAAPAFTG